MRGTGEGDRGQVTGTGERIVGRIDGWDRGDRWGTGGGQGGTGGLTFKCIGNMGSGKRRVHFIS